MAKQMIFSEEKSSEEKLERIDSYSSDVSIVEKLDDESRSIPDDEKDHHNKPPTTARDLVTEVLSVDDDPTLSPWTFRTWFIGLGLSIFAAYALSQEHRIRRSNV
jgi:hypothetical protein